MSAHIAVRLERMEQSARFFFGIFRPVFGDVTHMGLRHDVPGNARVSAGDWLTGVMALEYRRAVIVNAQKVISDWCFFLAALDFGILFFVVVGGYLMVGKSRYK